MLRGSPSAVCRAVCPRGPAPDVHRHPEGQVRDGRGDPHPARHPRENVDLHARVVRIIETTAELDRGGLTPETPKSKAGRRTVAFPAELVPELRWHLDRFAAPGERGLVFVGSNGAQLRRSNFRPIWNAATEKAGIPGLHFHDLPARLIGASATPGIWRRVRVSDRRWPVAAPADGPFAAHRSGRRHRDLMQARQSLGAATPASSEWASPSSLRRRRLVHTDRGDVSMSTAGTP